MRNLYKPVRYNVASIQVQQTLGGDCMESNENGIWVEFRDYLRLLEDYKLSQQWKREADAETLKFDSGDWFASKTLPERIKHIIDTNAFSNDQWKELNATLSLRYDATKSMLDGCAKEIEEMEADIERLRKAGDDMVNSMGKFTEEDDAVEAWLAAKEGKKS